MKSIAQGWQATSVRLVIGLVNLYWGQGLIPEGVNKLLRYAFENLQQTTVWCGYYDGNEKSKRAQEKCGFTYSHTEENKPVPLMNDFRTEHFTKITLEDWKNRIRNLK